MKTYLISTPQQDHRIQAARLADEGTYTTFYNDADALVLAVKTADIEYVKLESE